MEKPRPSRDTVGGLVFFGRMLDKIRLHARGALPADYNRGFGFDGRCVRFLRVDYGELAAKVLEGGADEELLEWCYARGRRPDDEEIGIWNQFMAKRGWRDDSTPELEEMKGKAGLGGRGEIQTFFDFHDADEGRL